MLSQSLEKHLWKDRVLLIIADSYDYLLVQQQLQELSSNRRSLEERKLVIYQVTPTSYRFGITDDETNKNQILYKNYNPSKDPFIILLLGLDGGVKMSSNKLLSSKQIFKHIDQMPMRIQELRSKKKS